VILPWGSGLDVSLRATEKGISKERDTIAGQFMLFNVQGAKFYWLGNRLMNPASAVSVVYAAMGTDWVPKLKPGYSIVTSVLLYCLFQTSARHCQSALIREAQITG